MNTNLTQIDNVSEESIHNHLKNRLDSGKFHTSVGYFATVQVNHPTLTWNELFQFVKRIVSHMKREEKDQVLYILGDAHTGKSMAYSKVMNALCEQSLTKNRVILAIPKLWNLLTFFGTCDTFSHSKSSQFLLYQEFQYKNDALMGLKTIDYGLDINRVIGKFGSSSCNFNIFYLLLSGTPRNLKDTLLLQDVHHYQYLNASIQPHFSEMDFVNVKRALKSIGITTSLQISLYQVLSAMLHLGNVQFTESKGTEPVAIKNPVVLESISSLLGLSLTNLTSLLTFKSKIIQGELCAMAMNVQDAVENRDTIVKCLYRLIFTYIIQQMNDQFCIQDPDTFIALADIPGGTWTAKQDTFSAFLRNYMYERFKWIANQELWSQTQNHFYKEGICQDEGYAMDHVSLELMTQGLLPLFTRQTHLFMQKKDLMENCSSLLEKFQERFGRNPTFKSGKLVKKGNTVKSATFSIVHYKNNTIEYDFKDFMTQNSDVMHLDLISLCRNSPCNPFLKLWMEDDSFLELQACAQNEQVLESAHVSFDLVKRPSRSKRSSPNEDSTEHQTLSQNVMDGLNELTHALAGTPTWQILCLSHHTRGIHGKSWDMQHVKRQIADLNLMSLIRYQTVKPFYIQSYSYASFVDKFKLLFRRGNGSDANAHPKATCQRWAMESQWEKKDIGFGRTEFFVSENLWNSLNDKWDHVMKKNQSSQGAVSSLQEVLEDSDLDSEDEFPSVKSDLESGPSHPSSSMHHSWNTSQKLETQEEEKANSKKLSPARKKWVCCTWCLTWYIPVISTHQGF